MQLENTLSTRPAANWSWPVFLALLGFLLLNNYLALKFLYSDETYYRSFGEQLAYDRIENLLEIRDRYVWVSYTLISLTLIIKVLFVAISINVGTLAKRIRISFGEILELVICAEMVFVFAALIKTLWLSNVSIGHTLQYVQYFYPLSLGNLFDQESISSWFIYPLQLINVFELIYWFVLAWLLSSSLGMSLRKSLSVLAGSYGVALLIWIVVVIFLSLSLS